MRIRFPLLAAIFLGAVGLQTACGGAHHAQASAPAPTGSTAQPNDKPLADQRREFIDACNQGDIRAPGYCECGWEEYRKFVGQNGASAADDSDPTEELQRRLTNACADKVPEESVKTLWSANCVGDKHELSPYCDCSWAEYRKQFSSAEFLRQDDASVARFNDARPLVLKACSAKLPEASVKADFLEQCMTEPKAERFCGCAWTALRKTWNVAELAFGEIEDAKLEGVIDKACSKLRPK
jgi:hypothetical protein